jgi:hypothetical protein
VVERPEDFDLQQVLANAVRDRAFIRKLAAEVGLVSEEGGL